MTKSRGCGQPEHGKLQISPLRSPEFPVKSCVTGRVRAPPFTGSRIRGRRRVLRRRKSGYAPVEMTMGRAATYVKAATKDLQIPARMVRELLASPLSSRLERTRIFLRRSTRRRPRMRLPVKGGARTRPVTQLLTGNSGERSGEICSFPSQVRLQGCPSKGHQGLVRPQSRRAGLIQIFSPLLYRSLCNPEWPLPVSRP